MRRTSAPFRLSERENLQKLLRHELPERVPCAARAVHVCGVINGFWERPPYKRDGKDWFGVDWIYEKNGDALLPDHRKSPVLPEIGAWRKQNLFPDLDAWDWESAPALDRLDEIDRGNKLFSLMLFSGPFERMHMLMGFESALCALLTEPEETAAFLDALMDYKLRLIDKIAQYYRPDILTFHDDYGTQRSLFFSPALWRQLFRPQLQKAVDRCHAHGILFEMHSCGMVRELIPDFAEMGCDSFNGMDIVNISEMKALTGDKLVYNCYLDYQRYLSEDLSGALTEEALRADVRACLLRNAEGGCYIPRPFKSDAWWAKVMAEEITAFCDTYCY